MAHRQFDETIPEAMHPLSARIVEHVERRFEHGDNHFIARGALASLALLIAQDRNEIIIDANERIVRSLSHLGAEAVVYAIRGDQGNGYQDSTDFVHITSRWGDPTKAARKELMASLDDRYVVRASTTEIAQ